MVVAHLDEEITGPISQRCALSGELGGGGGIGDACGVLCFQRDFHAYRKGVTDEPTDGRALL